MTLDAASLAALQDLGFDGNDPELQSLLVNAQADDLEWLSKVERQYPLACAALWTADTQPGFVDQRRSVAAVMGASTVGLVLGGERSGKSRGLKELTVAMALGGDHPMVREWLRINGLPTNVIPDGPAEVYAVALRSGDSVRYHRPDFDRLCPRQGRRWYNKQGKGEAVLYLDVPGYDNPGAIWFMAVDQGPDAMQGISLRWAWLDEEPLGDKGRAVYGQLRARVADQDGRIGISMVPMEGFTWVYDRLLRDREDDAVVVNLDTLDNPYLPKDRFGRHFAGMDDEELAQRRFGRFRARSGAVYSTWDPGDHDRWGMGHVCKRFEIPRDWPRFAAGDFGLVNPTCIGWGALGDDDTLYLYREWYRGDNASYQAVAEQVEPFHRPEQVLAAWGDPAAKEAREVFSLAGIHMEPANNDLAGGYDQVKERLRLRGDNRPRLKVFESCPNLIREMGGLVWDPHRVDRVHLKKDDHAPDMLRYMCMGIAEWSQQHMEAVAYRANMQALLRQHGG